MRIPLVRARDFRIGWRQLLQEPGYSAVTVLGLAVACAACFLLLGFVAYCLNYNSHVPDAGRVVVVKQRINFFPRPDWNTRAALPLRDTALASGMVEQAATSQQILKPLRVGAQLHEVKLYAADPALGPIFGIAPLAGDLQAALTRPDALALTRETALRLFGSADVLGKTVRVHDEVLQVLAVIPDVPANSTHQWEVLTGPLSRARAPEERSLRPDEQARGHIFLKLRPGADLARLETLLQDAVMDLPVNRRFQAGPMGRALGGPGVEERLVSLRDAYFDPDLAGGRDKRNYGQRDSTLALAGVALLILALAMTNWINLATVRTLRRQREIGMRKVLGASAPRVAGQFLAESVLVALLATSAGILLAWLLLPLFADLVNRKLEGFFAPGRLALALLLGAGAGLAAGLYPAWTALRVRPSTVLAGRDSSSETTANLWVRRTLTVLQFATAMTLAGITIAVGWQTWYATHADPGFDPAGLTLLHMPLATDEQVQGFVPAVARVPGIEGSAVSAEAIGRDANKITGGYETRDGKQLRVEIKRVSPEFFDLYGIRPRAGRLFSARRDGPKSSVMVLNMAAVEALGYRAAQEVLGKMPFAAGAGQDGGDLVVVGVAPDLRHHSMRERPGPIVYLLTDVDSVVTVRTTLGQQALARAIEPVWRQYFPNGIMVMQSAASIAGESYRQDLRMLKILGAASLVALALAAFGIYVLSAYTVQRSRREIVIRKLYGASNGAIARRLGREFGLSVAAAAALGLPAAAIAIHLYLAGFAEHAPLGPWPLVAALGLALLAALAATARHTLAAIRMSPVQALRGG
ncbi:ABC transporter permease [Massilia sp. GCM10023247]|uniref:ABC transporter permease n=1 Tax=Massilia sp. GCM10023247 TaxID=3252643 RepID=UPI00361311D2